MNTTMEDVAWTEMMRAKGLELFEPGITERVKEKFGITTVETSELDREGEGWHYLIAIVAVILILILVI